MHYCQDGLGIINIVSLVTHVKTLPFSTSLELDRRLFHFQLNINKVSTSGFTSAQSLS